MNSLFDSGQDYIRDYAAMQIKSAVDENKAKCYVLFLFGQEYVARAISQESIVQLVFEALLGGVYP